jgi:hypothetical protein
MVKRAPPEPFPDRHVHVKRIPFPVLDVAILG